MCEQNRLQADCVTCLLKKYMSKCPAQAAETVRLAYLQRLAGIVSAADRTMSAPEVVEQINALRMELFGEIEDYTAVKPRYNALMLEQEPRLRETIARAADPVAMAVRYAMVGNYIDFGAMEEIPEAAVLEQLERAESLPLPAEYDNLCRELETARRLVYLTDNCGEILLDKLLLSAILHRYTQLQADVIVRGRSVLNDATVEDARQVGLEAVAPITPNGTGVAGTCLSRLAPAARARLDAADVVIAKGQGNFETLRHCGYNIYYLFLCKCPMFARRFEVPLYTGMLVNDRRL